MFARKMKKLLKGGNQSNQENFRDILTCDSYLIDPNNVQAQNIQHVHPIPSINTITKDDIIICKKQEELILPEKKKVVKKKVPSEQNVSPIVFTPCVPVHPPQPTSKLSLYHVYMKDKKQELMQLYPTKSKKEIADMARMLYNDMKSGQ
jgi:hypothetical protein